MYPFLMPKNSKGDVPAAPCLMEEGKTPHLEAPPDNEYADFIDRRILSTELASTIFNRYINDMVHQFPAVVFPPDTTAAEVRKSKPTLFLAIIAAASGFTHPDVQRVLTKELMRTMAERIFCNGEKSVELIQTLHVSTLWYYPPERHEELKFYQFIHIAAVMAIDLGMGKKVKPNSSKNPAAPTFCDRPRRRCGGPAPDDVEGRRCWLACYFLGSK